VQDKESKFESVAAHQVRFKLCVTLRTVQAQLSTGYHQTASSSQKSLVFFRFHPKPACESKSDETLVTLPSPPSSMAQDETTEPSLAPGAGSGSAPPARLNPAAPAFTPRSAAAAAQHHGNNHPHRRGPQHHHHHYAQHQHHQHYQPRHKPGGDDEGDAAAAVVDDKGEAAAGHAPRGLPDDVARRVVKQVPFCCT
jgi:hypothetical protein